MRVRAMSIQIASRTKTWAKPVLSGCSAYAYGTMKTFQYGVCADQPRAAVFLERAALSERRLGGRDRGRLLQAELADGRLAHLELLNLARDGHREPVDEFPVARN